jgi:hypothetical protein
MAIDISKVKKTETKSIKIAVRTFPTYAKWLNQNDVSPTLLFNEAIKLSMAQKNE